MNQQEESVQPNKTTTFLVILVIRWLLGLYLIAGCILAAWAIGSNWASIRHMMESGPSFSIYLMQLALLLKLVTGALLLLRSKWLLVTIPGWIVVFIYDFFSRNKFDQLPPDFFLAVVMQLAIFSFVFWLHGHGRLK